MDGAPLAFPHSTPTFRGGRNTLPFPYPHSLGENPSSRALALLSLFSPPFFRLTPLFRFTEKKT